jgi:hypothetical protein
MRFRSLLSALITLTGCAVATSPIQGPAATTAFDGKYVGIGTITHENPSAGYCRTITSVDMTITGGRLVIHIKYYNTEGRSNYLGVVNSAGEVSTLAM